MKKFKSTRLCLIVALFSFVFTSRRRCRSRLKPTDPISAWLAVLLGHAAERRTDAPADLVHVRRIRARLEKRAPSELASPRTSSAPAARDAQLLASMRKLPCATDSAMATIIKGAISDAEMTTQSAPLVTRTSRLQGACHASARQIEHSGGARRCLEGGRRVWATHGATQGRL